MNPEVDPDEFRVAWLALEHRLRLQDATNLELLKERRMRSVTRQLRPLVFGQVVQTILGVALTIWSAVFWVEHRSTPDLMIAGLILEAYGLGVIISGARTLNLVGRIDYSVPVIEIDTAFARLRQWYSRSGMVLGLAWWLLWMPFMTMLFMSLFDVNMPTESPSVIWIGSIIGVVGLAATWIFHRWAYHPDRPHIGRRMADSTAGRSIVSAQTTVSRIVEDEKRAES